MMVRADVAELLHAGYSDRTIARQLQVDAKEVGKARKALKLPKATSGPKAAGSPEDLFWRRVKPSDDGHMEWTGYRNNSGAPSLRHGGRNQSAYRLAFRIANGREPDGYALPSCGRDGCVKPGHVSDRADREREQRVDSLYAAIFGASA
ncbi:hypothetical protein ACFVAF_18080 [Streptomyces sp. NPDC057596]|uniref:hypothetical protein n=1 Tax=Streptomyces sp. NPDC057596 TaxID=3346178 RepID=UPI0036909DB1